MQLLNSYNKHIEYKTNFRNFYDVDTLVILCHGFVSTFDNPPISYLYEELAKHHRVLTFNFVGEGNTFPSYTECLHDLFDIITYVHTKGIRHIVLVGHSMGAAIALLTANKLKKTTLVTKLILIAMPYNLSDFRKRYKVPTFKKDDLSKTITIKKQQFSISKKFIEDTYTFLIPQELERVKIPTLVIQGNQDTILKKSEGKKIFHDLFSSPYTKQYKKRKILKIIKGAGHLFTPVKSRKALVSEVESFIVKTYDE